MATTAGSPAARSIIRLSRIVLMVRGHEGVKNSLQFYHQALGLPVLRVTDDWAELLAAPATTTNVSTAVAAGDDVDAERVNSNSGAVTLSLQGTYQESQLSAGYTPWLSFTVESMDDTIAKAVQLGGHLDGPIQYPAHGKSAVIRSPDLHMIGLYEPATAQFPGNETNSHALGQRQTPRSRK